MLTATKVIPSKAISTKSSVKQKGIPTKAIPK